MKKTPFLIQIILFTCCFQNLFSQSVFSTRYNLPLNSAQFIDVAADGGFYFCGFSISTFDAIVGKIDLTGQLVWAKSIGLATRHEIPFSLITLSNGNVVIAIESDSTVNGSFRTYVISFDSNGNMVFCKRYAKYSTNDFLPNNMIRDGSGFTISIDDYTLIKNHILKLDSMGNRINGIVATFWGYKIFYAKNTGYLVYTQGAKIHVFDSLFNYQGGAVMDFIFPNMRGILPNSASTFFGFGADNSGASDPGVFKFNSQMQMVWRKHYQLPAPLLGLITSAQKTGPNTLVFMGRTSSNNMIELPFFIQTDTSGNLQRCIIVNMPTLNDDIFHGSNCYHNNSLTFIHNEVLQPNINYFNISSVDSSFSTLCNAVDTPATEYSNTLMPGINFNETFSVNYDSLSNDSLPIFNITFASSTCDDSTLFINESTPDETELSVIPNPAHETITIDFRHLKTGPGVLSIFDITGRVIYKANISFEKKSEIAISLFPCGIYTVVVSNSKQTFRTKFVKN